jgi:hypothetical protein
MTEDTLSSALLATVAHRIVCVSAFQASFLPPKLRTKVVILRNAVDESFFTDGANDNHVFVYGSAPNRGLAQLLLAWPLVRKRLPNATLTVFYGFTPQFEHWARRRRWPLVTSEPSTEMTSFDEWRAAMHALLHETPGVTYVGLVDHSTLAEAYAHSGFWLFPTSFSETSCISAMKAMANGAVPLTSRIEDSALGETIGAYDQGPVVINATKLGTIMGRDSHEPRVVIDLVRYVGIGRRRRVVGDTVGRTHRGACGERRRAEETEGQHEAVCAAVVPLVPCRTRVACADHRRVSRLESQSITITTITGACPPTHGPSSLLSSG